MCGCNIWSDSRHLICSTLYFHFLALLTSLLYFEGFSSRVLGRQELVSRVFTAQAPRELCIPEDSVGNGFFRPVRRSGLGKLSELDILASLERVDELLNKPLPESS